MGNDTGVTSEHKDHFEKYSEYNKILRTWIVTFGFGVPATILLNDKIAKKLADGTQLRLVVGLFLVGAAAQILIAVLNKMAAWNCYIVGIDESRKSSCWYKLSVAYTHKIWPDFLADLLSIVLFGVGIWLVFSVFAKQ